VLLFFFFKIGSLELFAQAGFKPQSFQVARIIGMRHWCPAGLGVFEERRKTLSGAGLTNQDL
jgi:hypothetical protein